MTQLSGCLSLSQCIRNIRFSFGTLKTDVFQLGPGTVCLETGWRIKGLFRPGSMSVCECERGARECEKQRRKRAWEGFSPWVTFATPTATSLSSIWRAVITVLKVRGSGSASFPGVNSIYRHLSYTFSLFTYKAALHAVTLHSLAPLCFHQFNSVA